MEKIKIYREMGWAAKVKILEDNSNDEYEKFKLQVLETICESKICVPVENGTIFDIIGVKSGCNFCWSLNDC